MVTPLIWVDFNAIGFKDPEQTQMLVSLEKAGTVRDLERHHIQLREGMSLNVYDHDADPEGNEDDLVAQGTVHYDQRMKGWVIQINVADIKSVSEVEHDPDHWASGVDWAAIHEQKGDPS